MWQGFPVTFLSADYGSAGLDPVCAVFGLPTTMMASNVGSQHGLVVSFLACLWVLLLCALFRLATVNSELPCHEDLLSAGLPHFSCEACPQNQSCLLAGVLVGCHCSVFI